MDEGTDILGAAAGGSPCLGITGDFAAAGDTDGTAGAADPGVFDGSRGATEPSFDMLNTA
jgi:hypothetical protein